MEKRCEKHDTVIELVEDAYGSFHAFCRDCEVEYEREASLHLDLMGTQGRNREKTRQR